MVATEVTTKAAASVVVPSLPRLGLGMAALGRPGYINLDRSSVFDVVDGDVSDNKRVVRTIEKMQTQANTVMDSLFNVASSTSSNGTTSTRPWLDCARSYGLSEKFVGEYLRSNNVPEDDVYVSSKWGYTYVADWKVSLDDGEPHEIKDHSAANFLKQVEETKEHLGEYLDLYQIHSATFESGILSDDEAHRALAKCKKQHGWSIGLSVSGPSQDDIIREAMKVRVSVSNDDDDGKSDEVPLFDSVQCTYNVLEQRPGKALQEARDAGMDIIIKEGLANGRALRNEKLREYAAKLNCQPDQLALGCILSQPFRPRVLSGAVTPEQLESNWKALEVSGRLLADEGLLQEIMTSCVMDSEEYWKERSALAWN